ncbi:MAG: hypothetical protein EXQ84_05310 [Rhodospirillaceae bacterium]|nr:hypothetical protein [Rhodospirillaceae bacterium]
MRASLYGVVLGILIAGIMTGPGRAHHYTGQFDRDHEITLTGTVKSWQWTNPHTWLILLATDAKGVTTEWAIESMPPSGMRRQGFESTTLKPGDNVTVVVAPHKDGDLEGELSTVLKINGQPGLGVVKR